MSRGRSLGGTLGRATAVVALVALLTAGMFGLREADRLTNHPRPDDAPRVDALLVLYSSSDAYERALELLGEGVADRAFVSAHLGPDDHERLCGDATQRDPRTAGVTIECFDPSPLTTQGEVMYGARRMRELGLRDLGVVTFDRHLERARILAERCWTPQDGTVSMYMFERPGGPGARLADTVYNTMALAKVAVTPGCDDELPAVVQWPLDVAKRLRGQPVEAVLGRDAGEWPVRRTVTP